MAITGAAVAAAGAGNARAADALAGAAAGAAVGGPCTKSKGAVHRDRRGAVSHLTVAELPPVALAPALRTAVIQQRAGVAVVSSFLCKTNFEGFEVDDVC